MKNNFKFTRCSSSCRRVCLVLRGISFSCVIAMLLTGCASKEEQCWKDAEAANNVDGYERYLKDYSQGRFVQEARLKLETAYKRRAITENTLKAYEDVLARYPEPGEEIRETLVPSKVKLEEDAARNRFREVYNKFKTIIGEKNISACESFLKEYPKGRLADEIRTHLSTLKVVRVVLALTGQAQGMLSQNVEMCARPVLNKNGFRIAKGVQENAAGTLRITLSGTTRSRPFTSQSNPKDVRQCVTSWRIAGNVSLELSGENVGTRNFKDQKEEAQGIPGHNIPYLLTDSQCHNSSAALEEALCTSGFREALSELVSTSHFKVGDRVQVDINQSSSPEFKNAPRATIVQILMWQGMVSGVRVRTDDGRELTSREWYLLKVSETVDEK